MVKRIVLSLLVLALCIAGWYLFIKEYDYQVNFKGNYGQASVYYDLLDAQKSNEQNQISKQPFQEILENKQLGDTLFTFQWLLQTETDSTTHITVNIKDRTNPLAARISVLNPFDNTYSSYLKKYFIELKNDLKVAQSAYSVNLDEEKEEFKGKYCVCAQGESKTDQKASEMLALMGVIDRFFNKNQLKPIDNPLLWIENWNNLENKINFNFCFPINKSDSLVFTPGTSLKMLPSFEAVTAEFTGNYKLSHRSWGDLLLKSDADHIQIDKKIIEVYYNNPMTESNSETWKSRIYMPVK